MAISGFIVKTSALAQIAQGNIDLDTDTFYAQLYVGAHTPAEADDQEVDLLNECADGDYSPKDVATPSIITVAPKYRGWDTADVDFGQSVTITAKYMYILKGDEASPLTTDYIIGWCDLNPNLGTISAITKASPAQVTSTAHGLINGDTVVIYGSDMEEVNRRHFTVANATANTFELSGVDSSSYLVAGTVGTWLKTNDTSGVTSNPIFQINAPTNGWFLIG